MASDDKIEMKGIVTKLLKGGQFEVTLNDNDYKVICKCSGRLSINKIRILLGDSVTVAISPYDLSRGIITWRSK